jgi:pyruvate/2-oxoglutarate/acetoin dehydrogenase E1 component
MPTNLGSFKIPVGVSEVVKEGSDITLVSYGSTLNICLQVVKEWEQEGISVEVVDVRTLLPLDTTEVCLQSVKKTNRLVVIDEDVPGGASAYILDHILNKQGAFQYLDSAPVTLTAKPHLPAYGTDGDYFSKPSAEDIFDVIYNVMSEAFPAKFPKF